MTIRASMVRTSIPMSEARTYRSITRPLSRIRFRTSYSELGWGLRCRYPSCVDKADLLPFSMRGARRRRPAHGADGNGLTDAAAALTFIRRQVRARTHGSPVQGYAGAMERVRRTIERLRAVPLRTVAEGVTRGYADHD